MKSGAATQEGGAESPRDRTAEEPSLRLTTGKLSPGSPATGGGSGAEVARPRPIRPSHGGEPISFLEILIIFANRKRLIAAIIAICGVIGLIIALVLPKEFTATSIVKPPEENSSLSSMLESQFGGLSGLVSLAGSHAGGLLKNPNDQYVAMFKSQTVEDATIRQFGLQKEYKKKLLSRARKAFEKHFKVEGNSKDGFLHVSVKDRSPERAAEMANGWVEQFRKLSEQLASGAASQRVKFFGAQLEQAKTNLDDADEALKTVQQKTGMIQLGSQAQALIESAAMLRAQVVAQQVKLQALQASMTSQNPRVIEAKRELAGLQAQLAKLGGNSSASASGAGLVLPKGELPQAGLEYVRKLREVKYREAIFKILARQMELAKLDEAKQGALIQVVDPAIVPDHKSSPHRALIVIIALVIGLVVGLAAAGAAESLDGMRRDPESNRKLSALSREMGFGGHHDPPPGV